MANYTSITASNICDAAGNKLASGTVSFQATDASNQPIPFQVGGGGQVVTTPAVFTITNGAIAGGAQVADSANTTPAGILYRIVITDTTLNRVVATYSLVTVTGTTFNLDNYSQTGAAVLPPTGGSVNGPLTVAGNMSVTGSIAAVDATFGGSVSAKRIMGCSTVYAGGPFANIQAAITDAGTTGCVAILPSYTGVDTFTNPNKILVLDYRNNNLSIGTPDAPANFTIIGNAANNPAGNSAGLRILSGPAGFSASNPAANNPVGAYIAIQPQNASQWGWAANPLITTPQNGTGNYWGLEVDTNVGAISGQTIGIDSVSGNAAPSSQPTAFYAFRSTATQGAALHKIAYGTYFGVSDSVFNTSVLGSDTGLLITQAVSSTGSHTVTTNAALGSFSGPFVGQYISVDSGGNQEDVQITAVGSSGGFATFTANFTKTHAINTPWYEYAGSRILDAGNGVYKNWQFVLGNLQKYAASNTPNVLGFSVYDSSGVLRLTDFYYQNNLHAWRDVGAGFRWENTTGTPIAALSSGGILTNYGGVATIANGIPSLVAKADLTAQAANVGTTTLYAVPANGAGTYRASVYLVITQAATTSSTLPTATVGFTDNDTNSAQAPGVTSTTTGNVVGQGSASVFGNASGSFVFQAKASTNITFATTGYASSGATPMQYAMHVKLEYLGL